MKNKEIETTEIIVKLTEANTLLIALNKELLQRLYQRGDKDDGMVQCDHRHVGSVMLR